MQGNYYWRNSNLWYPQTPKVATKIDIQKKAFGCLVRGNFSAALRVLAETLAVAV